jgi:4-amino-4-deoxy-L-arabinose transferase-like glycosyltransferase
MGKNIKFVLKSRKDFLLAIVLTLILLGTLVFRITGSHGSHDAQQNFLMSYNLYKHGIISLDNPEKEQELTPSMYREPFPIFVNALFMTLHPGIRENMPYEQMKDVISKRTKQVNLLWIFLGMIGVWWLTVMLTSSKVAGIITMLASWLFCFSRFSHWHELLSEMSVVTLLLASAIALIYAYRGGHSIFWMGITGILVGCLALTKAVFFYIFPVVWIVVFIAFLTDLKFSTKESVLVAVAMLISFSVIVFPWMLRNKVLLNQFGITQRGGQILLTRAYKNYVSPEEFRGMFYIWAPGPEHVRRILGIVLGFKEKDIMLGGRLQRLNRYSDVEKLDRLAAEAGEPDATISFFWKTAAERNRLVKQLKEQGIDYPEGRADSIMRKKAILIIKKSPLRHLIMTIPFAWRGMWCFRNSRFFVVAFPILLLNFLAYFSFMLIPIWAVKHRNRELLLAMLLPMGMVIFYSLFTHNIPRYNAPAVPFMLIALWFVLSGKRGKTEV